jgi:hypothetical protein
VVGTATGVRLLAGWSRILAAAALLMLPFAGVFVLLPIAVAIAALLYRRERFGSPVYILLREQEASLNLSRLFEPGH